MEPHDLYGDLKKCSMCKLDLPLIFFSRRSKHLLQSMCAKCRKLSRKIPEHLHKKNFRIKKQKIIKGKKQKHHFPIGSKKTTKDGYVFIKIGNIPLKPHENWVLEHRYVMECYLGRKLLKQEVVHHIDNNPSNNEIKNLMLLESQKKHREIHSKNINKCACVSCRRSGISISAKQMCVTCYRKYKGYSF